MSTQTPRTLAEAKALVASERKKVNTALEAIFGSRVFLAVVMALFIGFGAHLAFAPMRLPAAGFTDVSLAATVGLPPIDFGIAGDVARDAGEAAVRQGAPQAAHGFLEANPQLRLIINAIGFGASLVLAIWTIAIQAASLKRGVRL